ncbi:MAG: polysaccharide biosynthesis protein [Cyclobacteriaceae bacterium]|nr:polysaccharide biosynthesis protein [Cyclobacteriaceae bacterium]
MGTIRKQSIISTIYIYIGVIVGFVSTGILMPRFLSETQNGILKLLISYSMLFAQFASLGFQTATVRFFPYFKDKLKGHHGYFFLMMMVGIAGFVLFLILYYLIKAPVLDHESAKNSDFASYFFLIVPVTFFFLFFNLLDIYARVLIRSTIGTFLKELLQRIFILIAILLFVMDFIGFWHFIILYVVCVSVPTIILFVYLFFRGEIFFRPDFSMIRQNLLGPMVNLSVYGLLIGFSQIAIAQIDSILINFIKDPAQTGIYAITFYYGTLVILPSRAVFRIAPTFIAEAFKNNDLNAIESIQYKSSLNQMLLGTGLFALLWLNIDNVFRILPPEYLAGKYVIFFIGLSNLISMAGGLSSVLITNSEYYRYNGIFVFIYLLLTVGLNIFLINWIGIVGAAVAAMSSMLVFNLLKFEFLRRKFGIQPYDWNFVKIIVTGIISYLFVILFSYPEALILSILFKSALFGVLFVLLNYLMSTSDDFNHVVDNYLGWIRKKF